MSLSIIFGSIDGSTEDQWNVQYTIVSLSFDGRYVTYLSDLDIQLMRMIYHDLVGSEAF